MIKYLLDEHISHVYRDQLLHHEPLLTVLVIGCRNSVSIRRQCVKISVGSRYVAFDSCFVSH